MQLQFRAKCTLKETGTKEGEILCFEFNIGPLKIICIANMPREGETESIAYVKLELEAARTWEVRDAG